MKSTPLRLGDRLLTCSGGATSSVESAAVLSAGLRSSSPPVAMEVMAMSADAAGPTCTTISPASLAPASRVSNVQVTTLPVAPPEWAHLSAGVTDTKLTPRSSVFLTTVFVDAAGPEFLTV